MSNRGVRLSSPRSGQLVQFRIRPPTSEGHNSFVRTLIRVLLDSMERPLNQESIDMSEEDIKCQTEVLDRTHRGQVSSSSSGFNYV